MGKFFEAIPEDHFAWIRKQEMFWVGTAPLSGDGHVNLSPKGGRDCFHVVNANRVWYEDMTGSGIETISHLRENGRITIMFSAFVGAPRIMRLFGKGTVYEFGTPEYDNLIPKEKRKPGVRSAIVIDVHKVGTSCGYSVPFYEFKSHRTTLLAFSQKLEDKDIAVQNDANNHALRDDGGLKSYWKGHNFSVDGLPGMRTAPDSDVPLSYTLNMEECKKGNSGEAQGEQKTIQKVASTAPGVTAISFIVGMAIGLAFTTLRVWLKEVLPLS